MSDQSQQDKTEAPTPKRRKDAKGKGQVPRSQEVTIAFLLLASAAAIKVGAGPLATTVVEVFGNSTRSVLAGPISVTWVSDWIAEVGWVALGAMSPILFTMAGTALAIAGIQARGVLSLEPLKPQWSKLNPQKNIPKLWGWKAPMELGKSLVKLGIAGGAVYFALSAAAQEIPALGQQSPFALLILVQKYGVRLLVSVGLAYMALALIDYGYQLWQHERQLKMSREEIKRETKETEGDPNIKAQRRSLARSTARRRMMLAVSEADLVITNPTHVAVALKYDTAVSDAPIVVAKGERKVAERIKRLAYEAGVPVIENRPLARALLATSQIGVPIPMELYVAVAEILAFVFRQRRGQKRPTAWQGSSLA